MKRLALILVAVFGLNFGLFSPAADFNGDGTGDIAIFRGSSGLWSVRDVTRVYFGSGSDTIVPYDYTGDGTDQPAIFRGSSGLWAVRDITRVYFGSSFDEPRPGDYDGDGADDIGIFRSSSGMWAVRGVTRIYYGTFGDLAIPGKQCRLPVTGQTTSYQPGDDGAYQSGAGFNFEKLDIGGDSVTIDHNTGLMWASDGSAAGGNWLQQTGWSAAISYCDSLVFAGYGDWRLPNAKELQSIVDFGTQFPSVSTTAFPSTANTFYWSSTTRYNYTSDAGAVSFSNGQFDYKSKTSDYHYLRAVRGGQ